MLSLTTALSCPIVPATNAARQERCAAPSPEALLTSLVTHIRDKNLNDAQCVQAIKMTLSRLAG